MAMLLGLANGTVPRSPELFTDDLAAQWAELGIRCISTSFSRARVEVGRYAQRIKSVLSEKGIHVAQFAGVNANFVHHDVAVRKSGRESVFEAIAAVKSIGATMISSGCGTNSDDFESHFYAPHPLNYTEAARDRLVDELRSIAPAIEDAGILYTIECHQLSVMRTPEIIRSVLDEVDSPAIFANFDPVNLLDSAQAVFDNGRRMSSMVETVGPRYGPSCHIKDVAVSTDFVCHIVEVAPGEGVLDFEAFFAAAATLPGPTPLIVEHLSGDQVSAAIDFVRQKAHDSGVVLL